YPLSCLSFSRLPATPDLSTLSLHDALPIFPTAIEQFSFDRFDRVVSLSHCCAKSIVHPARVCHLCYCLTPMRYAWDQFDAYFGQDRKSTRLNSSHRTISYAVFCLKKKKTTE